jgi:hypothetical protein
MLVVPGIPKHIPPKVAPRFAHIAAGVLSGMSNKAMLSHQKRMPPGSLGAPANAFEIGLVRKRLRIDPSLSERIARDYPKAGEYWAKKATRGKRTAGQAALPDVDVAILHRLRSEGLSMERIGCVLKLDTPQVSALLKVHGDPLAERKAALRSALGSATRHSVPQNLEDMVSEYDWLRSKKKFSASRP